MRIKFKLLIMLLLASSMSAFSIMDDRGGTSGGGIMVLRSLPSSELLVNLTVGENTEVFNVANNGRTTVSVKNLLGSEFYKKVVDANFSNKLDINLLNLPLGSYTLTFTDANGKTFERVYFKVK